MTKTQHLETLTTQLDWLSHHIVQTLSGNPVNLTKMPVPKKGSAYAQFVGSNNLSPEDRVLLLTALAATLQPDLFTPFAILWTKPEAQKNFGGVFNSRQAEFYPTLRTAIFLLSGHNTASAINFHHHYHRKHPLFTSGILQLNSLPDQKKLVNHELEFNEQFLPSIIYGEPERLDGDVGFPAKRAHSKHTLKDVALNEKTLTELAKIEKFVRRAAKLWQLPDAARYRQNFIAVFTGDPGTGKSHTAEAIANQLNLPVYIINMAQMVDKYIGETEKNLEKVFDRFNGKPGILFFDEAEAMFSKRTEVSDSHDKYANNTQSFLLQAVEKFKGIIILATNVKNLEAYFDAAFQRRIRQIVKFEFPDYPERYKIWQNGLGSSFKYGEGLLEDLARHYQLNGGSIYNIISDAVIEAMELETDTLTLEMMQESIKSEFNKSGRRMERITDENSKNIYDARYGHRQQYGNSLTAHYQLPK